MRRFSVLFVATALLAAGTAGSALARFADDPFSARWQSLLSRDDVRFPAIGPLADAQVSAEPLYFQIAYVAGAIGGWGEPDVCPLLHQDPRGFDRAARDELFKSPADYSYIESRGWSVGSVLAAYRNGVLFGCSHGRAALAN